MPKAIILGTIRRPECLRITSEGMYLDSGEGTGGSYFDVLKGVFSCHLSICLENFSADLEGAAHGWATPCTTARTRTSCGIPAWCEFVLLPGSPLQVAIGVL